MEALELDMKNLIMLTHLFDVQLSALLVCERINEELSETCHLYHSISKILIVSATMALHNFVRLNDWDDSSFINANWDSISRREHNSAAGSSDEQNLGSLTDLAMVVLRDSIANSIWGDNN